MTENDLFNRFFQGNASPEEREQFLRWLSSEASEIEVERFVKAYFEGDSSKTIIWNDQEVLSKLKLKIESDGGAADSPLLQPLSCKNDWREDLSNFQERQKRRFKIQQFLKMAAVLFIVSALAVLMLYHKDSRHHLSQTALISKNTEQGQKLSFYLDDGTKVILNSKSSLTFPNTFSENERKVVLQGEAYFEVVKNPDRPFIVQTGKYITKVLGTSFVVHARSNNISVALRTGSVLVKKSGGGKNTTLLKPGESVKIDVDTHHKRVTKFEDIAVFGWTKGVLFFKEASFLEVKQKLEEWYDVDIILENHVDIKKGYSARFENESLENVLRGLSFVNDFDYLINGKQVTIKFKK